MSAPPRATGTRFAFHSRYIFQPSHDSQYGTGKQRSSLDGIVTNTALSSLPRSSTAVDLGGGPVVSVAASVSPKHPLRHRSHSTFRLIEHRRILLAAAGTVNAGPNGEVFDHGDNKGQSIGRESESDQAAASRTRPFRVRLRAGDAAGVQKPGERIQLVP